MQLPDNYINILVLLHCIRQLTYNKFCDDLEQMKDYDHNRKLTMKRGLDFIILNKYFTCKKIIILKNHGLPMKYFI